MYTLVSADLTLISVLCPKLVNLNIQRCTDALQDLLGLAEIGSNCTGLTALNITGIHNIESLSSLWEVLSSMKKLRYLSMGYSFLAERRFDRFENVNLAKMNLFAIDITSSGTYCDNDSHCSSPSRKAPASFSKVALLKLTVVLINKPLTPLDLTNVLPNLPCLKELIITIYLHSYGWLTLPTDTDCYSSLKRLYIEYYSFVFLMI